MARSRSLAEEHQRHGLQLQSGMRIIEEQLQESRAAAEEHQKAAKGLQQRVVELQVRLDAMQQRARDDEEAAKKVQDAELTQARQVTHDLQDRLHTEEERRLAAEANVATTSRRLEAVQRELDEAMAASQRYQQAAEEATGQAKAAEDQRHNTTRELRKQLDKLERDVLAAQEEYVWGDGQRVT